jgi:hypothetical protein
MHTFDRPREATVQFSDVFGDVPAMYSSVGLSSLPDFDAVLTAQVRNTNRWRDLHFPTGAWPALGDYGAVLLDQLRQDQLERAKLLGIKPGETPSSKHPDNLELERSLSATLVGVVNCAPRRDDHHKQNVNGDEFHVGVTHSGIEIYAQLPFFRGLKARNRLAVLYRIPNDAGVWPAGEQFRSSIVSQVRTTPHLLQEVGLDSIPQITQSGRVAYADKFGNVRLEMADGTETAKKLKAGSKVGLEMGSHEHIDGIYVVNRLTDIPEGELGIYHNPADPLTASGPHYVELVRRVSNPNSNRQHAYASLVGCLKLTAGEFVPTLWEDIDITITA